MSKIRSIISFFCFNFRTEIERLEQTVEDLKSQLRIQESIPTHETGMMSVTFLTETEKFTTLRTLEKVTR